MNFILGKDAVCPEALLNELKSSNAKIAIFSSEAWSNPKHLSHLTQLVSILEENGYRDYTGLLCLRNLAKYQVSHYREFTVNRRNRLAYHKYIQEQSGMFDYLFLVRSFRSIFGSHFSAIPFDGVTDIITNLLTEMGLGNLYNQMKPVDRANVKSLTALEVEAMRSAKLIKKPARDGLSMLSSIIADNNDLASENWTERFIGDIPSFTPAYRRSLREAVNWSESDIENLLYQDEPQGRNVQEISKLILNRLQNS